MMDAYTARKVLPRILIAAILINLSIYIINLMIDITNVIGAGLSDIMIAPLRASGQMTFSPSAGQSLGVMGVGFIGLLLAGGTIAGILGNLGTTAGVFATKAAAFILFSIVIPVVLAIIGVVATVVLRKGILYLLILSSPIAGALYCLPNTEKYFRKWWSLLVNMLLIYPIIVLIFAIADLLAVTTLNAGGVTADPSLAAQIAESTITNPTAAIIAFFLQFITLAMVPFAFKLAKGFAGTLYAAISGGATKVNSMAQNRRQQTAADVKRMTTTGQGRVYSGLGARGDRTSGWRRGAWRLTRTVAGGHNIHGAMAAENTAVFKEMEAQKDAGIDTEQRALTVNKEWALANDRTGRNHWRMTADGRREFKTLGGRWVDEASVDAAHRRWGGSQQAMQWSLGYEMQKATTQEQQDYLHANVARLNGSGSNLNMSDEEFGGLWTGAAFAKQNTDRQWKHYSWNGQTGQLEMNSVGMFQEIDERQGNWQMTAQHAETWTTMSEEVNRARQVLDTGVAQGNMDVAGAREVMQRGARIARSIGAGGMYTDPNTGQSYNIGAGAGGRTREEMENYASLFNIDEDYQPEVGLERRGDPTRRSGDRWQRPTFGPPPPTTAPPTPTPPPPGTVIPGARTPAPSRAASPRNVGPTRPVR